MDSLTILDKSSLKLIEAGANPPDCDSIPRELWKIAGCDQPFTPPDC